LQNPANVTAPTIDEFAHVKQNLSATDEDEAAAVIRNSNATMQKVLAHLKDSVAGTVTEPTSRRALAMAQLEEAIRSRKLSKSRTAAHLTKGSAAG
jgi:hypothetical protein